MSIYSRIYYNLCESRRQYESNWGPGSNLHRHHIVPKHSGGDDSPSNFTYLTVREHIIAHFLLWKMNKNPNDLRSMKMLGAKITSQQRKIMGEWCRDNKIGFHGATPEERLEWSKRGLESQEKSGKKYSFWWWSSPEGRKERASLGGKASIVSPNNTAWAFWASEEGRVLRATMGGKASKGNKCMYKPGDTTYKRVMPENIDSMLNAGYIFGVPRNSIKRNRKYEGKKVSDGNIVYNSMKDACEITGLSRYIIRTRCKSKESSWFFV